MGARQIGQLLVENSLPGSETARLDKEVLLAHALGKDRTYLYVWPEKEVRDEELSAYETLIARRVKGEPIAHIIGEREFWSLSLKVNNSTLIPRPDTEILVETILGLFSKPSHHKVMDLGTGTGAIALAIASERPNWSVYAADYSFDACNLANENLNTLGLSNVFLFCGSWLSAVADSTFDIIVSNPPYIPVEDPHLSSGDVRFEPKSALVAGLDGLDDIRLIVKQGKSALVAGGVLLIEHGFDQAKAVQDIFASLGYENITTVKDYGSQERATYGYKPVS